MKTKLFKKIGTLILALSMVMSMGTFSAFAAEKDPGVTVKGVESGATVQVYKIVKEGDGAWEKVNSSWEMAYTENGTKPYPTPAQLQNIAKDFTNATGTPLTESPAGSGTYSATGLDAGLYLVLVSGGSNIYNPMMVGVDYVLDKDKDGKVINSVLDLATDADGTAYAKMTEPKINKEITGGATGGNKSGSSAQYGDVLDFKITTTIPRYGKEYTGATFNIVDKLDAGLTLDAASVEIDGTEASKLPDTTGTFATTADGFTITYDSAYILAHGGDTITVTYKAQVNDNATINFDPNTNTATLKYTNTYDAKGEPKETTSKTYTYTFGFDANLTGKDIEGNIKTHDVIKLDENGNVAEKQTFTDSTTENEYKHALSGAEFTLYTDAECKTPAKNAAGKEMVATTTEHGYMEMKGLKEGVYYLKETKAPFGYTKYPEAIKVEIKATYFTDGKLESFTTYINGTETGSYSINEAGTKITPKTYTEDPTVYIKNTRIPGLPSTGGMGTYLFLIVGMAIMTVGAMRLGRKFKDSNAA